MGIFTRKRERALSTFHGSTNAPKLTPAQTERINLFLEERLNFSDPAVINGKSYGLVAGHPETQGVYTAYMSGYYNGLSSPRRVF